MQLILSYLIVVVLTLVLVFLTNSLFASKNSNYGKIIMQAAAAWCALVVGGFFSVSLLPFLSNVLDLLKFEGVAQTAPQIVTIFVGTAVTLVYLFTRIDARITTLSASKKLKLTEVVNFYTSFFLLPAIILIGGVWYLTH
jgi:hypothetical protein